MNKPCAGDMIAIPSGDKFGLAKVLYASEFFRNVLLIKIFREIYPDANIKQLPTIDAPGELFYTSSDPVIEGRWTKIGVQEVSDAEKKLSRRTVGGEVWVADEHIGPASDNDLETLPKMLTYGYRLVEKAISRMSAPN